MSIQFQSTAGINQIQAPQINRAEELPDFPPMPEIAKPKQNNSGALIGSLVGLAGLGIAGIALHKNYINKKQVTKLLGENKTLTDKVKNLEEKLSETSAKEVKEHWWNGFGEKVKNKFSSGKEWCSEKWHNFRKPKDFDAHEYYESLRRSRSKKSFWQKIGNFFGFKK